MKTTFCLAVCSRQCHVAHCTAVKRSICNWQLTTATSHLEQATEVETQKKWLLSIKSARSGTCASHILTRLAAGATSGAAPIRACTAVQPATTVDMKFAAAVTISMAVSHPLLIAIVKNICLCTDNQCMLHSPPPEVAYLIQQRNRYTLVPRDPGATYNSPFYTTCHMQTLCEQRHGCFLLPPGCHKHHAASSASNHNSTMCVLHDNPCVTRQHDNQSSHSKTIARVRNNLLLDLLPPTAQTSTQQLRCLSGVPLQHSRPRHQMHCTAQGRDLHDRRAW